jgi:hypothetical protein
MVEGLFARAFKSEVQPVEVAAALQRELDDQAAVVGRDRTLVPNQFVVELGDHDHDRLAPYEKPLTPALAAMVREHADDQRYTFVGPVQVELRRIPTLETGVFHVHSTVAPGPEGMPDFPSASQPAEARPAAEPRPATPLSPAGAPLMPAAPPSAPSAPPARLGVPGRGFDEPRADVDSDETSAIPRPGAQPTQPAQPAFGRIVVREGKKAAYDFELKHQITIIGRGTEADVRLTDQSVSRRHAEIRLANGATMLNDLQSTNGTTVNGVTVTTTALTDGDEIRLGETVLIFQAAGNRGSWS